MGQAGLGDDDGGGCSGIPNNPPWSITVLTSLSVEHGVQVRPLPSHLLPMKGMCCDCCLGGTSVIPAPVHGLWQGRGATQISGRSPPSVWGILQPTGLARATCEAACWGAGQHL